MEKIVVLGKIRYFSDPFKMDHANWPLMTIETDKGMVSVPVEDTGKYVINQDVKITIKINET